LQGWSTVQENAARARDKLKDLPHVVTTHIDETACNFDVVRKATLHHFADNERAEEFECELLWQTTRVDLEARADHDD